MRPPSSGNAGIRLKTSRKRLTDREPADQRDAGRARDVVAGSAPCRRRRRSANRRAPTARHDDARSAAVTAGPAAATWNSSFGERESRLSFATPPNSQRSMPAISIPWRRATSACPSSCSSSETKNSIVAATATGRPSVSDSCGSTRVEVVRQPVDHQEEDEEPARAGADADPEDAEQLVAALGRTRPDRTPPRRGVRPSARLDLRACGARRSPRSRRRRAACRSGCRRRRARREAQNASATSGGAPRTSSEPWSASASSSTSCGARVSSARGIAELARAARAVKASRRASAPAASSTSARKASSAPGERASARSTSSAMTLPEPSQIEHSGASRYRRGMPGLLDEAGAAEAPRAPRRRGSARACRRGTCRPPSPRRLIWRLVSSSSSARS